jgi:hypothetical protein
MCCNISNDAMHIAVPQALSEFGDFQSSMTKIVSNKLARYVMISWGRANRIEGQDTRNERRVFTKAAAAE